MPDRPAVTPDGQPAPAVPLGTGQCWWLCGLASRPRKLYLLDTDLDENAPWIASCPRVSTAATASRVQQEIILGVGGVARSGHGCDRPRITSTKGTRLSSC